MLSEVLCAELKQVAGGDPISDGATALRVAASNSGDLDLVATATRELAYRVDRLERLAAEATKHSGPTA